MEQKDLHPFVVWFWETFVGAAKLAVILFPVAMLLVILGEVVLMPMITKY